MQLRETAIRSHGAGRLSQMQSEVFEAFRAIDIPEAKASRAATALGKRDDDVTTLKG